MRQFIRHPSDIPLEYVVVGEVQRERDRLKNIGCGGLCFTTGQQIPRGCKISVRIPLAKPPFTAHGVVVWCRNSGGISEVGVEFEDKGTQFALRMVEQVCHIEHYRHKILKTEGRNLSGEEAAMEWIAKHAQNFPG